MWKETRNCRKESVSSCLEFVISRARVADVEIRCHTIFQSDYWPKPRPDRILIFFFNFGFNWSIAADIKTVKLRENPKVCFVSWSELVCRAVCAIEQLLSSYPLQQFSRSFKWNQITNETIEARRLESHEIKRKTCVGSERNDLSVAFRLIILLWH